KHDWSSDVCSSDLLLFEQLKMLFIEMNINRLKVGVSLKVLILINSFGGLYNFRREFIQRLIDKNNQVSISGPNHELIDYFIELGCQVIETPFDSRGKNLINDLKLFLSYTKLLKEVNPDVVLTYTIKPNIYG